MNKMNRETLVLGKATIAVPPGWYQAKTISDGIVLSSPDDQERATISVMHFATAPTFDDFKQLSRLRVEAEQNELADGFVQPTGPTSTSKGYLLVFSGGDRQTGRVFSGYSSLVDCELITVYVEGIGVAANKHLESFRRIVQGIERP
jgi:hypothetical protein